ncbi:MAG: Mov34/MPN/PAD-1 family protein [Candidatus Aminicenantes bacterium]|nr:MAG: Mov34/MPN/PAD-1 family protein [Candidatus Aminicenantes bacterium]
MTVKSPDVSEINLEELEESSFPSLAEYRVAITDEAYKNIHKHSRENTDLELCGVLIGRISKDKAGPFLFITDIIRGEYAENEGVQVTFTHETWAHISDIKDSKFPDKLIVGWYHTHPRFGIFLSEQDLFIHKNFFNNPWQVAFVVDPIFEDEGFFAWYNGEPTLIHYYWVAGRKRKISNEISQPGSKKKLKNNSADIAEPVSNPEENQKTKESQSIFIFIILVIIMSFLLFYLIRMNNHLQAQLDTQKEHLANISYKQSLLLQAQESEEVETTTIENALAQNPKTAGLSINLKQKENHVWCYGEVSTGFQKELIGKVIAAVEGVEAVDLQGVFLTHRYLTQPGDNLIKIADKLYGNPGQWKEIFNMNKDKISSPDKLQPGIILVLPGYF